MLSRMLDQADRNRGQGNYSDAARQYRSVLNCDPNNSRAHSGLELTLVDIQHQ
jgi:Flp pilus assembly protein TadD